MTGKKINEVHFNGKNIKVRYIDFKTLKDQLQKKLEIDLSEYLIQYQDKNNKWFELHDDDDLEDVSDETKIRVVSKNPEKKKNTPLAGNNTVVGGAGAMFGNAKYTKGGKPTNDLPKKTVKEALNEMKEIKEAFNLNQDGEGNFGTMFGNNTVVGGAGAMFGNASFNEVNQETVESVEDLEFKDGFNWKNWRNLFAKKKTTPKEVYKSHLNNEKCYSITPWGKSQALIINIEEFDEEEHNREGARQDTENLEELLPYLGFEVEKGKKRMTEKEIFEQVENFKKSEKVANAPMTLLFIGSHGKHVKGQDFFLGSEGALIAVTNLLDEFKTTEKFSVLNDKPKLFWFQFCRDEEKDKPDSYADGKHDSNDDSLIAWYQKQTGGIKTDDTSAVFSSEQEMADMFFGYATFPGAVAYRNVNDGSWFVLAICKVCVEKGDEKNLSSLFKQVNEEVMSKGSKEYFQMCEIRHTMEKDLFFDPQ